MTQSDSLARFTALVDRFEQVQGFIDQARAMAARFRPEVIQRVIDGHQATINEVLTDVVPLMMDLEQAAQAADARRADIDAGAAASRFALEELELRHLIGELDDDGWLSGRIEHEERVAAVDRDLAEVDAERDALRGALARWDAAGKSAGVLQA